MGCFCERGRGRRRKGRRTPPLPAATRTHARAHKETTPASRPSPSRSIIIIKPYRDKHVGRQVHELVVAAKRELERDAERLAARHRQRAGERADGGVDKDVGRAVHRRDDPDEVQGGGERGERVRDKACFFWLLLGFVCWLWLWLVWLWWWLAVLRAEGALRLRPRTDAHKQHSNNNPNPSSSLPLSSLPGCIARSQTSSTDATSLSATVDLRFPLRYYPRFDECTSWHYPTHSEPCCQNWFPPEPAPGQGPGI